MTAANHDSRPAATSSLRGGRHVRGSSHASTHGKALRLLADARRPAAEGLPPVHGVNRLAHGLRRESGQSVVEFGMVVPLLCALVLVFVDFGKSMNYWIDLTHVANQIARQAAVN